MGSSIRSAISSPAKSTRRDALPHWPSGAVSRLKRRLRVGVLRRAQTICHYSDKAATGDVIVVRYADDSIVGFEHRHEAEQFLADLKARLARFGLNLHPDKTRLIEFGRNAIANRRAQGLGKPETFDFLGFKHYCGTRRDGGGFVLGRKPMAKRMRTKLREIKEQLMATRHDGIDGQGKWLAQVLRGWMAYYAVPMSGPAI